MRRPAIVLAIAIQLGTLPPARAADSAAPAAPEPERVRLAEVVVTPSRFSIGEARPQAWATLTAADLESLPQVGEDLYRSIARLPGLAADDFTAKFWVRGAPNDQMLVRLDGVDLLEPFHLKDIDGALSIIDLQAVERLDLTTGGFTAEHGDRLAAVLSMETAAPAAGGTRTEAGLSLSSLRLGSRGAFAGGRGRWLAAVRRGYPDLALKAEGRDDEVFPRYGDLTAKIEYDLGDGHVLSVHGLQARDTLRVQEAGDPPLRSRYGSDYAWARWRGPAGAGATGEAVLSVARLTWRREADGLFDNRFGLHLSDRRRLAQIGLRSDWTLPLGERSQVRAGAEAKWGDCTYDYVMWRERSVLREGSLVTERQAATALLHPSGDEVGVHAAFRTRPWERLTLEAGLRHDRQTHTGDSDWSPRLNVSGDLGPVTLRAAWGLFRQAQGLHQVAVQDGDTVFRPSERAEHRVIGVERRLWSGARVRVEAYERLTSRLRPHWDNLLFSYNVFPETLTDRVRFDPDRGRARGVEVLVQGGNVRWNWSASYALARAEERVAGRWLPRARDQLHTVNADVRYQPGVRWQFSASWRFHTGWPETDATYALVTLANGKRTVVRTLGPAYGGRLPDYHRLDLRATRRWVLPVGELRVFLDVFNAYDRRNVLGYDRSTAVQGNAVVVTEDPKELLPVLPSVGIEWVF